MYSFNQTVGATTFVLDIWYEQHDKTILSIDEVINTFNFFNDKWRAIPKEFKLIKLNKNEIIPSTLEYFIFWLNQSHREAVIIEFSIGEIKIDLLSWSGLFILTSTSSNNISFNLKYISHIFNSAIDNQISEGKNSLKIDVSKEGANNCIITFDEILLQRLTIMFEIRIIINDYIFRFYDLEQFFDDSKVKEEIKVREENIKKQQITNQRLPEIAKIFGDEFNYRFKPTSKSLSYKIDFPANIKDSRSGIYVNIELTSDMKYITYQQLSRILSSTVENKKRIGEFLISIGIYKSYVINPTNITIGYEIYDGPNGVKIDIKFLLELITNEDYWKTIGFYRVRTQNICEPNSRYPEDELYEIAKDLGINIKIRDKRLICKKINNYLSTISIRDFEL